MKSRRERSFVLLLFNCHARWQWGVNATFQPLYSRERDLVRILQEAGWVPGPVWMDAKNFASTRIRSPDRPNHSDSYRLSYPGPSVINKTMLILHVVVKIIFTWIYYILPSVITCEGENIQECYNIKSRLL